MRVSLRDMPRGTNSSVRSKVFNVWFPIYVRHRHWVEIRGLACSANMSIKMCEVSEPETRTIEALFHSARLHLCDSAKGDTFTILPAQHTSPHQSSSYTALQVANLTLANFHQSKVH